ncbi:jerky protein homolog-like [Haliotis asinina]|uniref:jerky protein homolog-like n=1 Tax=Haliotis asinina TaxID=109174 RepID=UPI0035323101
MSAAVRKRKVLTFEEKLDIVQRLENNERASDIAIHYDIGKSTVHEIMRNRKQLFDFCSTALANEGMTKRRRVMRRPTHEILERCMHIWYIQERIKGSFITGPVITRKATYFDQKLNGENTKFKASSGWLFRFKQRCGIEHLHAELDLNAVMQKDISSFQEKLKAHIREKGLAEHQIYYACEVRLSWKSLPVRIAQMMKSDMLSAKERLTFLLCVNGTGSHKLPLLVIANPGNDAGTQDNADLPSRLVTTDDASLDPVILKNWFTNGFIPAVKAEAEKNGYSQNAVLILESSPAHPFATDELTTDDGSVRAIFLPPNCTNKKLSLCSGIPEIFKKEYRLSQVKKAFVGSSGTTSTKAFLFKQYLEGFNLETALQLSVDAWSDAKRVDIAHLWAEFFRNLSIRKTEIPETDCEKEPSVSEKIHEILSRHEFFKEVTLQDIVEWVEKVDSFLLFPLLSDVEIIEKVKKEIAIFNSENKPNEKRKRKPSFPSDADAVVHFEKCIRWLKNQPECNSEDLKMLRRLKLNAKDKTKVADSDHQTSELAPTSEQMISSLIVRTINEIQSSQVDEDTGLDSLVDESLSVIQSVDVQRNTESLLKGSVDSEVHTVQQKNQSVLNTFEGSSLDTAQPSETLLPPKTEPMDCLDKDAVTGN